MTDALSALPSITDPAAAAAAGKCYLARSGQDIAERQVTAAHPRPCEWCGFPLAHVIDMLTEFEAWARYSRRTGTYGEPEVARFAKLPRLDQVKRSHRAAYPEGMDL